MPEGTEKGLRAMTKYFRDIYGGTASIRLNRNGTATLKVSDAHGKRIWAKDYTTEKTAKSVMSRFGDGWRENR